MAAGKGEPLVRFRIGAAPAAIAEDIRQRAMALDIGAPVTIRVSARARRLSLRVDAASRTVELVLPRGTKAEHGLRFVANHRGWIAERLGALPQPVAFVEGAMIPVFGVPHRICRETGRSAPPVAVSDGEIRVRGEELHIPRRVRDHLMRLVKQELTRRAHLYAARVGKTITHVGVRDTKSRWGSCSGTGSLSFSWRLVFAPEMVLDCVVAHEVAHLVEMNHSVRFWRVAASLTPDHAAARAWLKRHRNQLFSYG
jgi:predicted metal-dependent hydrolase